MKRLTFLFIMIPGCAMAQPPLFVGTYQPDPSTQCVIHQDLRYKYLTTTCCNNVRCRHGILSNQVGSSVTQPDRVNELLNQISRDLHQMNVRERVDRYTNDR